MSDLFDITIVKQPQHAIKFLTLSDVKRNRGAIKNREGGKVKIEATFKGADKNLCPQKLKVLVSAFHRDESTLNEYLPSRYSIQKCGSEPREITWDQFEKPMTKVSEDPIKFQYELENAFIFAPFEKDQQIIYFHKYYFFNGKYRSYLKRMSGLEETNEFLNQQIEKLKKQCCEDEYKDSVCLRFDVFSEIVGSQKVNSHGRVHSENIDRGVAKFKINVLCNTHIPNDGKGVMFLLLNKKYESGTACLNEKIDADWTANASIKNYSNNNAVSLEMPKKEFKELVRHCSVWLQETKLGKNGLSTPSEEFYYVNVLYASEERESKLKKFNDNNALLGPGLQFDDTGNGNAAVTKAVFYFAENNGRESSVLITERIEQADYAYQQKHGNGLFHAAMLYNKLSDFLAIGSTVLNDYMAKVRNADNETLLHYACKHNKPELIDDLLKIGCPLDTPCLHTYQTALHTAIYMHHKECLMKFVKLIQAPQRLGVCGEAVSRLMLFYDGQGFTVAHAATLNAEVEILDVVLRFCKATGIEILRKRTLTLEFSLLDLAKKSGEEMIKIHISNLLRAEYGVVGNDDESDDDAGSCRPMSEMLNLRVGLRNLV